MAKKRNQKKSSQTTDIISEQAANLAQWTAQVLAVAEQLELKNKVVDTFVPGKIERTVLSILHTITPKVRKRVKEGETEFTAAEVAGMAMAVAEDLPDATPQEQVGLLMVGKSLMDSLHKWISKEGKEYLDAEKPKSAKKVKPNKVYQFKITLFESNPPIWRRIQVEDCTLDEFHEHIQTAMGWTNSHLHQFEVKGKIYGDPELLNDDVAGIEFVDSTQTMLSEILPANGKRFRFKYQYDFGDGWEHEVLFEGCPAPEKGKKYPLCLEGERACPPEDCGGVWGYADLLAAVADPKHEEHESMVEWLGKFDPDKFDAAKATKAMKKGLPDWRSEDDVL
jgi:hypothetical protein